MIVVFRVRVDASDIQLPAEVVGLLPLPLDISVVAESGLYVYGFAVCLSMGCGHLATWIVHRDPAPTDLRSASGTLAAPDWLRQWREPIMRLLLILNFVLLALAAVLPVYRCATLNVADGVAVHSTHFRSLRLPASHTRSVRPSELCS
eukprot:TRINITY_DN20157_c0_g1_i1.p2 TRINITY_DN20157_c0_g1~~TRINITY_DN20157_c0_g1_i1.p2  ORF type:complete len:148 (-),score=15.00 TRINITY_DN20157_c0_g1_i1:59-502(-)